MQNSSHKSSESCVLIGSFDPPVKDVGGVSHSRGGRGGPSGEETTELSNPNNRLKSFPPVRYEPEGEGAGEGATGETRGRQTQTPDREFRLFWGVSQDLLYICQICEVLLFPVDSSVTSSEELD
ncbi:hypothetical protein F2P81_000304 [Scophthalmus maximus]|uniref:Uncharacterized protein n=1 Tax=Scophthalmus maximus TaxID=52904 RepID=A0A6A4TVH4_SCOMX|nr:hypothetical protein F2P81_000304 [Scophthalmus maximus]